MVRSESPHVADRSWFAVMTVPQNEKSVVRHFELREVESFLPTYESRRVWKNRQRKNIVLPLFPTYVFVHISPQERTKVLQSPGVLQIVGNRRECVPVPDIEIDLLRSNFQQRPIEPYRELLIGQRVRIKSGAMRGVQGTLIRKGNRARFVLTLELINQHAAIEVDPRELEPIAG